MKLTQDKLNNIFAELKAEWDKKVRESGRSESMFIAMDKTGYASEFLLSYEQAKENVESYGLVMPVLIKGLKITID